MSSIITRHVRLSHTAQLACSLHASSVQLVGRKKRLTRPQLKASAMAARKEHSQIYEEEDQFFDLEEMTEWEYDDHHTFGHLLLDSVRDVRKYLRQIQFEHPTLAKHAKPFQPPPKQNILQFERSFTMGEKYLAQDRKAVLRVKVAQLGLKDLELRKFLLLAGVRYNPETDELKMSESREATSLLNKKRLADTLVSLITEAKKKDDMFADVPLEFSYHKYKPNPALPAEWLRRKQRTDSAKPSTYIDDLTEEQQLTRELVLAHVLMLKVKSEVAQGRHRGSAKFNRQSGWASNGDSRALRVALITQAFHWQCPGLLLNLLLDWPSHAPLISRQFMDKICQRYFDTPEKLNTMAQRSQAIYKSLACQGTKFVDGLWNANNLDAGANMLSQLVELSNPPALLISSLAVRLMHMANKLGRVWVAHSVFNTCKPWLNQSPVAYSILLHPLAQNHDTWGISSLVQQMQHNRVVPDSYILTDIIGSMCRSGNIEQAKDLLSILSGKYTIGIKLGLWSSINSNIWLWLYELSKEYNGNWTPWQPTLATHQLMIKAFGRAGMVNELLKYYELSANSHSRLANLVDGYIAQYSESARQTHGLGRAHTAVDFQQIIKIAQASGHRTSIVYNMALKGYASDGDFRSIVHHMERFPKLNGIEAWTSLIQCMPFRLKFIFRLHKILASRNIHFTADTFSVLIRRAVNMSDSKSILRIIEFMKAHTTVRFDVGMLMDILSLDVPFSIKCKQVQYWLESAPNIDKKDVEPCHAVIQPNQALVTKLIDMAKSPKDLKPLRDTLQDLQLYLTPKHLSRLRAIGVDPEMQREIKSWY
ncbi:37S ribosomal protein S24, mitochondrial [Coemansia sp. RSA 1250]|nr:37S ribosomal protein S24, mitochondrial [Coemansia sp. RSA 1250]